MVMVGRNRTPTGGPVRCQPVRAQVGRGQSAAAPLRRRPNPASAANPVASSNAVWGSGTVAIVIPMPVNIARFSADTS